MGFDIRFQVLTLPGRPYAEYRAQVMRVEELGFDIGLYYPSDPGQIPAFERLATEVIPELRS